MTGTINDQSNVSIWVVLLVLFAALLGCATAEEIDARGAEELARHENSEFAQPIESDLWTSTGSQGWPAAKGSPKGPLFSTLGSRPTTFTQSYILNDDDLDLALDTIQEQMITFGATPAESPYHSCTEYCRFLAADSEYNTLKISISGREWNYQNPTFSVNVEVGPPVRQGS